jgi:hypothetical protein
MGVLLSENRDGFLLVLATFALLVGGSVDVGEAVAAPRYEILLGAGLTSLPSTARIRPRTAASDQRDIIAISPPWRRAASHWWLPSDSSTMTPKR